MLISATALLRREPDPDEEAIRANLSGNLCRCTGYQNIVKAVGRAAEIRREALVQLADPGPSWGNIDQLVDPAPHTERHGEGGVAR
jgi:hypothetical protein